MRSISYTQALREAITEELRRDGNVILLGEDIAEYGGAFGVTRGLLKQFGPRRILNTPISEGGFVGTAVGAAMAGSRPVVEIMFMDFMTQTMDQLVNQAAKLRYVFGPEAACPLVVRTAGGAGRHYGPTHSQTFDAWFLNVPGLRVAVPTTPADAKALLKTAIRSNDPVVFIEHKSLYGTHGPVPQRSQPLPFGRARVARKGHDITLVAWSQMTLEAEAAASELAHRGISAEVIDLRTLNPLDTDTVTASVRKTGRVLVVDESPRTGGVSAEIGCRIFEEIYDYLDAPFRRLTGPDTPIPAAPALESAYIPNRNTICAAATELLDV